MQSTVRSEAFDERWRTKVPEEQRAGGRVHLAWMSPFTSLFCFGRGKRSFQLSPPPVVATKLLLLIVRAREE